MSLRSRRDPQEGRALSAELAKYNELTDRVRVWGENHEDPGIRTVEAYSPMEAIFSQALRQGAITREEYDFAKEIAGRLWRTREG